MRIGIGIGLGLMSGGAASAYAAYALAFDPKGGEYWVSGTRYGASDGPQLIPNGDFSTGIASYTAEGTGILSDVGGKIRVTAGATAGGSAKLLTGNSVVANKRYRLRGDLTASVAGMARITLIGGGGTIKQEAISGTSGSIDVTFASPFSVPIEVHLAPSSPGTHGAPGTWAEFDNLSLVEIPGVQQLPGYTFTRTGAIRQETEAVTNNSLYGPELVTNGDGSTTAGWVAANNATLTSVGGKLRVTSAGTAPWPTAQQVKTLTAGQRYRFRCTFTNPTGKEIYAGEAGSGVLGYQRTFATSGTIDVEFVYSSGSARIEVGFWGSGNVAGDFVEFDDISLTTSNLYQYEGPELVADPSFDTGAGAALTGSATISGGNLTLGAAVGEARIAAPVTSGARHKVVIEITSGSAFVQLGNGSSGFGAQGQFGLNAGNHELSWTPNNVNSTVTVTNNPGGGGASTTARVSVKQVFTDAFDSFGTNEPAIVPGVGYWSRGALTNALPYSQDFSTGRTLTGLLAFGSGSTANAAVAPDGTTTMDYIREDTSAVRHWASNVVSATAATKTYSFFVKAGERTKGRIAVGAGSAANAIAADFDLVAGTITAPITVGVPTPTAVSSNIISYGNGLFRVVLVVTTTTSSHLGYVLLRDAAGADLYTGDGVSGFYVWQEQMIDGNLPDGGPIIATAAAAVSVGADALDVTSPDMTGDYIAWGVAKLDPTDNSSDVILDLGNAWLGRSGSGVLVTNGGSGSDSVNVGTGGRVVVMQRRVGNNSTGFFKRPDGTTNTSATGPATPIGDPTLNIGHYGSGSNFEARGVIEGVFIRKGTFTDAECLAIVGAA